MKTLFDTTTLGSRTLKNRAAAMALAAYADTPVVLVGGLRSVEKINQFLDDTRIEYVSLSRPLIHEPNLIRRWQSGDTTPSKCVSCNTCYRTPGHQCIFLPQEQTLRHKITVLTGG